MNPFIAISTVVCLYVCKRSIMSMFYTLRKYLCTRQAQKKLTIFYVDNEWYCDQIIHKYFMQYKVLGLDCEWVTIGAHQEPVSLLQIANPDGICALFRMPKLYYKDYYHEIHVVSSLRDLLGRGDIIKVGVAIENDSKYLARDYNVRISSWLDLRHIAKDNDVLPRGLAYLAHETVGIKLDKTFNVRVSNWDAEELSEEQIQYAAMDAHAAISIFNHFVALKQSLLRLLFPITWDLHEEYIRKHNICAYLELNYKDKQHLTQLRSAKNPQLQTKKYYSTFSKAVLESAVDRKGFQRGKLYDNCYLLDTLSQVLCTCDRKKAQWYLDKDLAVLVQEDPFTVRLLFQPTGFDRADCKYYSEEKRNQCVVCGSEDPHSLVKKYVVPHEYRKHLPEYMKDRRSHDVLLMCWGCHKRSNAQDQRLRLALASECSAPIDSKSNKPVFTDFNIRKVKSAAQALLRHEKTKDLPRTRELELIQIVSEHYADYGHWPFLKMVYQASALCDNIDNPNFVPHGLAVVQHFALRDQLPAFETRWRQHFLQTMQPHFLPPHWSVHHNHNQERASRKSSSARSSTSTFARSNLSTTSSAKSSTSSYARSNLSTTSSAKYSTSSYPRSNLSTTSSAISNPSASSYARSNLSTTSSAISNPRSSLYDRFDQSTSSYDRSSSGTSSTARFNPGTSCGRDPDSLTIEERDRLVKMVYDVMHEPHKFMKFSEEE